jgi:hypothetical protein
MHFAHVLGISAQRKCPACCCRSMPALFHDLNTNPCLAGSRTCTWEQLVGLSTSGPAARLPATFLCGLLLVFLLLCSSIMLCCAALRHDVVCCAAQ